MDNKFNMTARQIEIVNEFVGNARYNAEQAVEKAKAARDAYVTLPATNENGQPVLWGANKMMLRVSEHWLGIALEWIRQIPDRTDEEAVRKLVRDSGLKLQRF